MVPGLRIAVAVLLFSLAAIAPPVSGQSSSVLYVSSNGNDRNDGLTWQSAKRTVQAAVAGLPYLGKLGAGSDHYGVITIGPGLFVEQGNLELNQNISYIGAQTSIVGFGTTIRLADHADGPLFSYTPDWAAVQPKGNAYSHFVALENLDLDGNARNQSPGAASDLVRILGGGFNTFIRNVTFQNARRYGLYLDEKQVSFSCYTCTFAGDRGGAVYANDTDSATVITFVDTQIDNDGPDAITINTADTNYANGGTYVFINLKSEATSPGNNMHVIRHNPSPTRMTFPPEITVIGSYAYTTATADAMYYEAPGKGAEARWNLQNAFAQMGYTKGVFYSAKSGIASQGNSVSLFLSNDPSEAAHKEPTLTAPDVQLSDGVTISGGGDPSGTVAAAPGSLYLDRVHGELWLKHIGSGTTGWVKLSTH